jgi:hypothetical protein
MPSAIRSRSWAITLPRMRRSELARVREMEAALAEQEQELGADDPRTIDSRLRLIEAYDQLPDYEDEQRSWQDLAIAELDKAVDSRVAILGWDHRDTLTLRYELAFKRFYLVMNDPMQSAVGLDELVRQLRGVAAAAERVLGSTHPDTLGYWLMLSRHCPEPERAGMQERVIRGWERVRTEREQQVGPDDTEIHEVVLRLARLYEDDRPEEAQRLRERAVAGWGRVAAERVCRLGPVHPDTVAARERHIGLHEAWVSGDNGDRRYEELVADHERLLGPDHPRTLHARLELLTRQGLSDTHPSPENIAVAAGLIDRVRAVLGPDHEDFRMLRYRLVVARLMVDDEEAAHALMRRYPSPSDDDFFRWEGPGTTA